MKQWWRAADHVVWTKMQPLTYQLCIVDQIATREVSGRGSTWAQKLLTCAITWLPLDFQLCLNILVNTAARSRDLTLLYLR